MDGSEEKRIKRLRQERDETRLKWEIAYMRRDIIWTWWQVSLPAVALLGLVLVAINPKLQDPSFLAPAGSILLALLGIKWRIVDRKDTGDGT